MEQVADLLLLANVDGKAFIAMTDERLQEIGVDDSELRQALLRFRDLKLEEERRREQLDLIKQISRLAATGGDYIHILPQIHAELLLRILEKDE